MNNKLAHYTGGGNSMKSKISGFLIFCIFWSMAQPAFAQEANLAKMIGDMQKQMQQMQQTISEQSKQINELKTQNVHISAPSKTGNENVAAVPMSDYEFNQRLDGALGGSNKWLKDLKAGGDIRFRYEAFHQGSGNTAEADPRNRFRFRLRYGLEKKISDEWKAGFSLNSGERKGGAAYNSDTAAISGDPTSTNATFDNMFNWKDIFVEKVYGSYAPNWAKFGPVTGLEITGGKFTNPFEKGSSDIVWDRDVKPEGAYEKINFKMLDSSDVKIDGYAIAGQYILEEDSNSLDRSDAQLFAYQAGINPVFYTGMLERPVEWLSAFSFYDWQNFSRKSNFLMSGSGVDLSRGNSKCNATELCTDFKVIDIYNELTVSPYGIPVRPFYDFAHNVAAGQSSFDRSAWALGFKVGKSIKKGDIESSLAYKWIGRDAVTGFNDSDFTGASTTHTGTRGLVAKAGYLLTDNVSLNAAAYFLENLNHDSIIDFTGTSRIRDEQQRRFQADISWKF